MYKDNDLAHVHKDNELATYLTRKQHVYNAIDLATYLRSNQLLVWLLT